MENGKRKAQDGRPKKIIKAEKMMTFRLSVSEHEDFKRRLNKSGINSKTDFIKAAIFEKQVKVVQIDKDMHDFHMRLTTLYSQFRAIGINYNQVVKQLNMHFSEKKALAALKNLENLTIDLIKVNTKITQLADSFEKKWLQKL
jgi:hypothetical protein